MPAVPKRVRAKAAILTVFALVALGSVLPPMTPPANAQTPALTATLGSTTPSVTKDTKQVTMTGQITNTGKEPVTAVKASLWISQAPINTREQLTVAAGESLDARRGTRITEPESVVDDVAETLRPGAKASFSVTVPVSVLATQYDITRPGVYLAGVDIRSQAPGAYTRDTSRLRTFLPWVPATTTMTPVEVAYVVPLSAQPDLLRGNTLLDAENAMLFAPNRRLSRLLELGAAYNLSYLVDPALLEQASEMQDGYRVNGQNNDTAQSIEGSADARTFLDRATGLLGSHDTLMLPYADPDLPALHRHHLSDSFAAAIRKAADTTRRFHTSGTVITWPGDGHANAGMLETIADSGGKTVLLSRNALPTWKADGSAPVVSIYTSNGPLTGLVNDPTLTAGGPGGDRSALQTRQRFLAETSLLAMRSGDPKALRRVVAAFPREWDPGGGGGTFFDTVKQTSWLKQISAGSLLSQAPVEYTGDVVYPSSQTKRELDNRVMKQLLDLQTETNKYLALLAAPNQRKGPLTLAFLRGASTAWRTDQQRDITLVSEMTGDLRIKNTGGIQVLARRAVTMTGSSGAFPVTVENGLSDTVRIRLRVVSRDTSVLRVQPTDWVEIPPDRKETVKLYGEAPSGRSASVSVQIQIEPVNGGTAIGKPAVFLVRVMPFGQIGWAVIGTGIGLLLLAVLFRLIRRLRRRSAVGEPESDPAATSGNEAGKKPESRAGSKAG